MKVYRVIHKREELCTFQRSEDAELFQCILARSGVRTSIKTKGVAYRVWPAQASPPVVWLIFGYQPTRDSKSRCIIRHVLFNGAKPVVNLLKRITQLNQ